MIPAVAETSEASIDEVKFHYYFFKVTKFSKEWKVWPKTHFLAFVLFVGNFSNKHYNLLKILRIFCFWYFCPKWLFPELFVLKVDLCTKVVALIKITTVYTKVLKCYFEFIRRLQQKSRVLICLLRGEVFPLCLSCAGGFADRTSGLRQTPCVFECLNDFPPSMHFSWRIPGLTSQRHSALINSDSEHFQVCFSAVHYLKISEQRWFSSEQRWKRKFSELKNQRWIRAVSALIFSETELIFSETALKHQIFRAKKSALNQSCFSADFLWNRAEQRWFSLTQRWKTKNPQQGKSALNQCCFSADFPWKRADTHWSLLKQLSSFLIFPWDNAEHPETSYSFCANFCRKAQILSFPGNLEIIRLWQIFILFSFRRFFPGNPRSQALWKFRSWSFSANFCRKAQILSFPGNLEIIRLWQKFILFSFRRFFPGNPRSQALWKFRSWSFSANFCGKA